MKNIWRVYISDLRRITTNVVALSIVMGLCIIPSLYAWFNILSNWDPWRVRHLTHEDLRLL